ncbi:MAG: insulinase family protein, partial [Bacteroidia bacterium]|nr:insulinase family protein [Bacteroidia bacterium]
MNELLSRMPAEEKNFALAKDAIKNSLSSERIIRDEILWSYDKMLRLGYDYDNRKDIFGKISSIKLSDIEAFSKNYVQGKPHILLVMGDQTKLDMQVLKSYGEVKMVTMEEILGY